MEDKKIYLIEDADELECWRKLNIQERLVLLTGLYMVAANFFEGADLKKISQLDDLNSSDTPEKARIAINNSYELRVLSRPPRGRWKKRPGFSVLKFAQTVFSIREVLAEEKGGQR
ncbi:MAG: hypothetical protein Q8R12_03055 [bacterium]|nr:hypothetical protein [bacterium]